MSSPIGLVAVPGTSPTLAVTTSSVGLDFRTHMVKYWSDSDTVRLGLPKEMVTSAVIRGVVGNKSHDYHVIYM